MNFTTYIFFISLLFCVVINSITNKKKIRFYVMLSSYGDYNIFLPLVNYFWKKIGFKPIITIVFHKKDLSLSFIKSILEKEGAIVKLKYISNCSNLNYFSRVERIFNFYRVEDKNGIYITSDADIIPINGYYYKNINYNMFNIKSYGINGYGSGKANRRWPMCYFISKIEIWKDILHLDQSITRFNIDNYINNLVESFLKINVNYYAGSYHRVDEIYMRDNIRKSNLFPKRIIFNRRNFYTSRITKDQWIKIPQKVNWSNIYDIHIPTHISNFTKIWLLIEKLLQFYNIRKYDINYVKKYLNLKNYNK